jgi:hypothetical protein
MTDVNKSEHADDLDDVENIDLEDFEILDDDLEDIALPEPTALPQAKAASLPDEVISFFKALRRQKQRINYGLFHLICVHHKLAKATMQARSFGGLVKKYVPQEFMHYVCRLQPGADGEWYSDIAKAQFIDGWETSWDHDDKPEGSGKNQPPHVRLAAYTGWIKKAEQVAKAKAVKAEAAAKAETDSDE